MVTIARLEKRLEHIGAGQTHQFRLPPLRPGGKGRGDGPARDLVQLSDGFHVEEGRVAGARHVIVCDEIDPVGAATPS